ncbi:MAG: LCP family protein [Thermicanus sp.]|nr:LCP family protein [Thermicanus sp.]
MEPQLTRRRKRKRLQLKRWQWIVIVLVVLLGSGGVYAYMKVNSVLDNITTNGEPLTDEEKNSPPPSRPYSEDPFAMILLGKDSRQNLGLLNTDVMIVAVVQPKEKKVKLLSIPRDTRVMIPEEGYAKINSAYARGESERLKAERNQEPVNMTGIRMVKKTLEGFLGIPIEHYVTVDFEGFRKVIDELGGIEVNVERRLVYHDPTDGTSIDLQPGLQVLDGQKALDYVRHRHDDRGPKYYSSDFERNEREREVIRLVADKVKSLSGISHIFSILDIVGGHITTDLSKDEIIGLANTYAPVGSSAIETIEANAYWDGVSYTRFSKEEIDRIRHELWAAMGMTEEEGLALVDPANDEEPVKKVVKKSTAQPKKETSKEATPPDPDAGDNQKESTDTGNSPEAVQPPTDSKDSPSKDGNDPGSGNAPSTDGTNPPGQGGTPGEQTPPDQGTVPPASENPPQNGGGEVPPGNTASP